MVQYTAKSACRGCDVCSEGQLGPSAGCGVLRASACLVCGGNFSLGRSVSASGGVYLTLPTMSVAPAPSVDTVPAPVLVHIESVPAESVVLVSAVYAVRAMPVPMVQYIDRVPALSVTLGPTVGAAQMQVEEYISHRLACSWRQHQPRAQRQRQWRSCSAPTLNSSRFLSAQRR